MSSVHPLSYHVQFASLCPQRYGEDWTFRCVRWEAENVKADETITTQGGWFKWRRLAFFIAAMGPGVMVMLADTDAGSIVTAAQSGASWGYKMVLPQLVLMPILFLIQEVTVRLGVVTGRGHGELIRESFGVKWALLSVFTLFISSVGALVTEFSGIAGVSELFGVPKVLSVSFVALLLILLGVTGSYGRVERIGIAIGLFELLFIPAAFWTHPDMTAFASDFTTLPLHNRDFLYLAAANVGAVIMPWMVFYQQGAVIDKNVRTTQLKAARWDTLVGSVVTQLIMIAVVVTAANTAHRAGRHALHEVQQIAAELVPFLGNLGAKLVFGLGLAGAAFVAALVVSVGAAWGLGEVFGWKHSLNHPIREAKWFYGFYVMAHLLGATLVFSGLNLVSLTVDVEVMNAILLPIVLGFLLALEAKALPPKWRMHGLYKYTVWSVAGLVSLFGLYMAGNVL